jgi:hypothetical protein
MMMSQKQTSHLLQLLLKSPLLFPKRPSLMAGVDLPGWEEPSEKMGLLEEAEETLWNAAMNWVSIEGKPDDSGQIRETHSRKLNR